jgi:hypothetical protein
VASYLVKYDSEFIGKIDVQGDIFSHAQYGFVVSRPYGRRHVVYRHFYRAMLEYLGGVKMRRGAEETRSK